MGTVLGQCGADVATVPSAAAALDALRRTRYDVLLSDISMPGEDGYQLMRKVRALNPAIPAAAVTAFARSEDREAALELPAPGGRTTPLAAAARRPAAGLVVVDVGAARIDLRASPDRPALADGVFDRREVYRAQFAAADKDGNGYLDEKETQQGIFANAMKVLDGGGG